MELERYELSTDIYGFEYFFYSEGPKGRIKKIITFRHVVGMSSNVFNLAFGDWEEATGRLNDRSVSNNNDQLKVLNTVAKATKDFLEFRPGAFILMRGSTSSRIRLYQMTIATFWHDINQQYELYGKFGEEWISFRKGLNFEEFMIFRKI